MKINPSTNEPTKLIILLVAILFFLMFVQSSISADFAGILKKITIQESGTTTVPPTAVFNFSNDANTFDFDASGSASSAGSITSYRWDFGDGTTGNGVTVGHHFNEGSFLVTLTIVDGGGVSLVQKIVTGASPVDVIIDNSDSGFSVTGSWAESSYSPGYIGTGYRFSQQGDGTMQAIWEYDIIVSGNYNIYSQWTAADNRAIDAPYTIKNNSNELGVTLVDQQVNGGQFNLLGTYHLDAGILQVILTNQASRYVIADAIRIESNY